MKSFPRNLLIRMVLLFPLLSLVACGGGGGGSGVTGGGNDDNGTPPLTPPTPEQVAADAANAIPKEGSVTQSSRTDNDNVTLDQVQVSNIVHTADNSGVEFTVLNPTGWGTITHNTDEDTTDFAMRPDTKVTGTDGREYAVATRGKTVSDGIVIIEVFSDVKTFTEGGGADDYLAGGMWLYVPDFDENEGKLPDDFVEIGAFVDGKNPTDFARTGFVTRTGEATYNGDAAGLYYRREESKAPDVGSFTGSVELTAEFNSESDISVSGEVTNIMLENFDRSVTIPAGISVTLDDASFNPVDPDGGNFFTGDTTGSGEGIDDELTGSWGGQFYGADADKVGGTFGISGNVPADLDTRTPAFTLSAVGAFITEEDDTP